MIVVYGNCKDSIGIAIASWFKQNSGECITSAYSSIGFLNEDGIKGALIFCDYTGSNIEAHIHAPGCVTKDNYKKVLDYVFNQLKCNRFTAKPYRKNKKVINMVKRLGFQYEGELKQYYGLTEGEDAIVYTFYREDAKKWINLDAR